MNAQLCTHGNVSQEGNPRHRYLSNGSGQIIRILLLTAVVAALPGSVQAADFIWSGCGADNNWNNPENWSVIGTPEDALPGFFDNVIFGCIDAEQGCFECNPDKDCVVTQEQLMFNLTLLPEYDGRISFQGSLASWDTG